jgi:hypothetical protein
MKKEKWSDYAGYLILSDKSKNKIGTTFETFMNFKKVRDVINNIAFTDKSTFSFEGQVYKRKITTNDAKKIMDTITDYRWNSNSEKIFLVSNQLGLII